MERKMKIKKLDIEKKYTAMLPPRMIRMEIGKKTTGIKTKAVKMKKKKTKTSY